MTDTDDTMNVQMHVPHPGSRLDAIAVAAEHEAPAAVHTPVLPAEPQIVLATRSEMPEETVPRMIVLGSANPYLAVLPRDMRRRRAVLVAIDNDVVLAETKELAQAVATQVAGGTTAANLTTGAYLPKGLPGIVIESRDWMFAAATTTSGASRVTVLVERYAQPLPD